MYLQICSLERQMEEERNKLREEEVRFEHTQHSMSEDLAKKDRLLQQMRNSLE
jgi:hypothetical protein